MKYVLSYCLATLDCSTPLILLHFGCSSYDLHSRHRFLSTWCAVMLKKQQKKTVDLDHRLSLSVTQLVTFWFKRFMPTRDSPRLCVHMRCLSICAPLFVALVWCNWALRVIAFGAGNKPQTVSHNLTQRICFCSDTGNWPGNEFIEGPLERPFAWVACSAIAAPYSVLRFRVQRGGSWSGGQKLLTA